MYIISHTYLQCLACRFCNSEARLFLVWLSLSWTGNASMELGFLFFRQCQSGVRIPVLYAVCVCVTPSCKVCVCVCVTPSCKVCVCVTPSCKVCVCVCLTPPCQCVRCVGVDAVCD